MHIEITESVADKLCQQIENQFLWKYFLTLDILVNRFSNFFDDSIGNIL